MLSFPYFPFFLSFFLRHFNTLHGVACLLVKTDPLWSGSRTIDYYNNFFAIKDEKSPVPLSCVTFLLLSMMLLLACALLYFASCMNQLIYVQKKSNEYRLIVENEDSIFRDPDCDAAMSYSTWSPCLPNCKRSASEMGKRTRKLVFSSRKAMKECGVSVTLK